MVHKNNCDVFISLGTVITTNCFFFNNFQWWMVALKCNINNML